MFLLWRISTNSETLIFVKFLLYNWLFPNPGLETTGDPSFVTNLTPTYILWTVLKRLKRGRGMAQCSIKNGPFPASFSLFSSFPQTVHSKYRFNKSCQWLDSNLGPLAWTTAMPAVPLSIAQCLESICCRIMNTTFFIITQLWSKLFCFRKKLSVTVPSRPMWRWSFRKKINERFNVNVRQCDQIGQFFKVICDKISCKTSPNIWQLFGLF